jgi:hypothetical protein
LLTTVTDGTCAARVDATVPVAPGTPITPSPLRSWWKLV